MNAITTIKYVFTTVGAIALIIAFFLFKNTSEFLNTSTKCEGTVIKLIPSSASSSSSTTYKPVVQFTDQTGIQFEFSSSTSSNPPSFSVGEKVTVLYSPKSPNDAKIKSFFSLWGAMTIVGGLGTVFFLIGGAFFVHGKKKGKLLAHLKQHGIRIDTDFQSVAINNSFAVNGRNPFEIITQWQDPSTLKIHVFTSENIWYDPTEYIKTDKVQVLIDRKNPKKYWMDVSFLPEVIK